MYSLCLDFGNTRLKYGIFKNEELLLRGILNTENAYQEIISLTKEYDIQRSILSTVVSCDMLIKEYLAENTEFHLLQQTSNIPFSRIAISKKEIIGTDRLALCAGATLLTPPLHHSLIISIGTCITYNFLDYQKMFLGGSISPGLAMRYKAIHEHTHLLPLLTPNMDFSLIGYDSATNIHSGILLGMAMEIEGIINLYQQKYNQLFVCLTGGDVDYLVSFIKNKIFVDNCFLLKGLFVIGKLNWSSTI
ncbi:MAG: type III pantothenate kinase [Chitinophagaceae bacterium]